jgi:zinc protease
MKTLLLPLVYCNEVKPGSIVSRESNQKIGTKTLVLSNGVKVTYKNTDFKTMKFF